MENETSWKAIQQELANALEVSVDALPRWGTHEWFGMMSELSDSHPEVAERVRKAMVEQVAPEPLPMQGLIKSERQRSGVRSWLTHWALKKDPIDPKRPRWDKSVVVFALMTALMVLWVVFRMHQPTPPVAPAPTATHQTTIGTTTAPTQAPSSTQATTPSTTPPTGNSTGQVAITPPPIVPPMPSAGAPSGLSNLPTPSTTPAGSQAGQGTPTGSSSVTVVSGTDAVGAKATVVALQAEQSAQGSLTIATGTAPPGQQQQAPGSAGLVVVSAQGQGGAPGQGGGGVPGTGSTPSAPVSFKVGDQFTVKTLTPIAVSPAWQAIPAVAQVVDGPLAEWRIQGATTLGQDGSIQIAWSQVLSPDGKSTATIQGIAFDPVEGKPGVPKAQTQVMAPNSAKTVLSGTLGAVSSYVQDQINAQQVQVLGSVASITSQVPPFWQILAQQLATGFQPAPVQTGGMIVVSRIPAGTSITVFITQTSMVAAQ